MTPSTRLLTQRDLKQCVTMRLALSVVREAFKAHARGEVVMPPKVYLTLGRNSDFRAMPAFLKHPGTCGLKWVNVHPHNRRLGLPTVMAVLLINDPKTGFPLAVMDGLWLTKVRTAAAAAVAARALARPESRIVGLVGCGAQADAQLEALALSFRLRRVKVWGAAKGEAQRFCRRMRAHFPRIDFEPCNTIAACAGRVDILVTLTPSRKPLVRRVAPGTHINAIGADAPGKQELHPDLLKDAVVIVDEREQAIHGGELNVPVTRGQYDPRRIRGTIGEVLVGKRKGRMHPTQITLFDSTGIAIHDVALGHAAIGAAIRRRIGLTLRLF